MDMSTNETLLANAQQSDSQDTTQTPLRAFHHGLIDRLFARFSAMYGNKFFDMWANSNFDEVKKCWADELRIFSVDQVKAAIDGLKSNNFPPTLPEFLQLCAASKAKATVTYIKAVPRLQSKDQPGDWHAAKARCMELAKQFSHKQPSNDWANRILQRVDAGENIPADSMRMAMEAMK